MWRKQPEAKPSSPAPNNNGTPPRTASQSPTASPARVSSPQGGSALAAAPSSPNAAVLTRGIRIKGELTGKAELYIDGEVDGKIYLTESSVAVGPAGRVNANIDAREIVVRGKVNGNLRGRDRIALGATSEVKGDLESPRVAMEDGAQFRGRVEMGPTADARERIAKRPSASISSSPPAQSAKLSTESLSGKLETAVEAHTPALKP